MHTDDRPNLVPTRRDLGGAELARPSALANPRGGGARLAIGRRDMNVAAKADILPSDLKAWLEAMPRIDKNTTNEKG